jgi:hypothetical protein
MDKGAEHNIRVWTLFQTAGFETKPNSFDPAEHIIKLSDGSDNPVDLYAKETSLNVSIIGSNKARTKLKGYHAHILLLNRLKQEAKAGAALFVASEKEFREVDRKFASDNDVFVWDEKQLYYYEAVAKAIGKYAKYEIIHGLRVPTAEQNIKLTVPAIQFRQPNSSTTNPELFLFTLSANTLLKTCVVLRKAMGSAVAYQRVIHGKRLPRVGQFVMTPDALLPTNIVVHFGETIEVDKANGSLLCPDQQSVNLSIPLKYGLLNLLMVNIGSSDLFTLLTQCETTLILSF